MRSCNKCSNPQTGISLSTASAGASRSARRVASLLPTLAYYPSTLDDCPTVYIDRYYDDPPDGTQPWRRLRCYADEPAWTASTGGTTDIDETAEFHSVDDAIRWARQRAEIVLVRLGSDVEADYSAGVRPATWFLDGTGWPFPLWPPAEWPDYRGPPEPGWPPFEAPDDD
jgi:hypothetical protein